MGEVFVFDRVIGKVVPKHEAHREHRGAYVISDMMEPTPHPATGKIVESKSEMSRITRSLGLTEVGTEALKDRRQVDMPSVGPDLARAWDQLTR